MECRFQEIFACGIRNPGLWNPEYSSRNLEYLYDWDPEVSMTKNLKSSSRNAEPMEWNPESKIVKTEFAQPSAHLLVTWPFTRVTW